MLCIEKDCGQETNSAKKQRCGDWNKPNSCSGRHYKKNQRANSKKQSEAKAEREDGLDIVTGALSSGYY